MKNAGNGRNADAGMISKTFFRLLPIQFLLNLKADGEAREACRPCVDDYMEKARPFSASYSEAVRRAMEWYDGRLPESAVRLPEIPYLCYQ